MQSKSFWDGGDKKTNMGALKLGALVGLFPLIAIGALYGLAHVAMWFISWLYEWFGLLGVLSLSAGICIGAGVSVGRFIADAVLGKK